MLLAASLAAPVPKAKPSDLFYPIKVGTKRVLETKRGDSTTELIETVSMVETKDGIHTVTVAIGEGETSATYTVSAKGLFRRSPQGNGPVPLLKLDVKVGETWEYETEGPSGNTQKATYTLGKWRRWKFRQASSRRCGWTARYCGADGRKRPPPGWLRALAS